VPRQGRWGKKKYSERKREKLKRSIQSNVIEKRTDTREKEESNEKTLFPVLKSSRTNRKA